MAGKVITGTSTDLNKLTGITTGVVVMQFVDPDGNPLVEYNTGLNMVVTPGVPQFDFKARNRGELAADEDFVANINRTEFYMRGPRTDQQGRVTLKELIPGATYRMYAYEDGENKILEQFTVESGETRDLGEFAVARTE